MYNATVIRTDIDICMCGASKLQVEILVHCRTRREKALTEAPKSLAASIVIDDRSAGRLTFLSLERSLPLAIPEVIQKKSDPWATTKSDLIDANEGCRSSVELPKTIYRQFAVYPDLFVLLDFVDEYPSAYHPPPFNSNEQVERIFLAFFLHLMHWVCSVPMGTRSSVTCPFLHSNS